MCSRLTKVLALISLREKHAEALVYQVLFAVGLDDVTGLARHENLGDVTEVSETLIGELSFLKCLHVVKFLLFVP